MSMNCIDLPLAPEAGSGLASQRVTVPEAFRLSLDALLKVRKISQTELAERSGRSDALVSRYLNGSRVPRLDTVESIREALDVSPVMLFDADAALGLLGLARRETDTNMSRRRSVVGPPDDAGVNSASPTVLFEGGSALAHPDQELLTALIAFWDQMTPEGRLELVGHGHRLRKAAAAPTVGFRGA